VWDFNSLLLSDLSSEICLILLNDDVLETSEVTSVLLRYSLSRTSPISFPPASLFM
jgi:hypothetical protein